MGSEMDKGYDIKADGVQAEDKKDDTHKHFEIRI